MKSPNATNKSASKGEILVRLNSASVPAKVISFYQGPNTGSQAVTELAVQVGESVPQTRRALRQISRMFANVVVRQSKTLDTCSVLYHPIAPEEHHDTIVVQAAQPQVDTTVAAAQQAAMDVESGKSAPAAVEALPAVAAPQATRTNATDVVWAHQPDVPSVARRYSFFVKPWFFDHMTNKVTQHKRHIRIFGPPGIGKTTAFEVLAAILHIPLVSINADAGLHGRQLIGGMTNLGRFEVSQFATAVVRGWWSIINEANAMDADASLILNGLLAPPYQITINGVQYPVHPNWRLCITYNPGLIGTKPIPESLADRFYPFAVGFPDKTTLYRMLANNGVDIKNPDVVKLVKFALNTAKERKEGHHRYDMTIRRLTDAWTDIADGLTMMKAVEFAIIAGIGSQVDQTFVNGLAVKASTDNSVDPDDAAALGVNNGAQKAV